MGRSVTVRGYYSPPGQKPAPCTALVSFEGYGLHESLTVDCRGAYRLTLPFRPLERLVAEGRQQFAATGQTVEPSLRLEAVGAGLQTQAASAWFRANGQFEMLTLELGNRGQISVPYGPVEGLARAERSTRA